MLCKNIKKKRHIQEKSPFWRERRLAGLSQEKAAERLGISTRTLQKYERGKAQPRFDMVVRMAEIYGCDLYAFLCSRRAGGMTGYRYAPVRVRSFRPDCSCVYGILVRKLGGGTDGGADRHPRAVAGQRGGPPLCGVVRPGTVDPCRLRRPSGPHSRTPSRLRESEHPRRRVPGGGASVSDFTAGTQSRPWPRRSSVAEDRPPRSCGSRCRRWATCPAAEQRGPWGPGSRRR